ncbi:MAG: ribonuclease E activity regulator RraA [Candidatus Accumulibacter sp.]|nr:ribonuclease E activity regulator RraA [Accumulibacter sp.]
MSFKTPDLLDEHDTLVRDGTVRVVDPIFRGYGARKSFSGQIVTLKIFEDNSLVRDAFAENGQAKVLVIDGGGSLRCALIGDQLAVLAQKNGWAGAVVYGCIRDSADIERIDVGIRALNTHPLKSVKRGVGERNIVVTFGGVSFKPGAWLYADEDGIIVSDQPLS